VIDVILMINVIGKSLTDVTQAGSQCH